MKIKAYFKSNYFKKEDGSILGSPTIVFGDYYGVVKSLDEKFRGVRFMIIKLDPKKMIRPIRQSLYNGEDEKFLVIPVIPKIYGDRKGKIISPQKETDQANYLSERLNLLENYLNLHSSADVIKYANTCGCVEGNPLIDAILTKQNIIYGHEKYDPNYDDGTFGLTSVSFDKFLEEDNAYRKTMFLGNIGKSFSDVCEENKQLKEQLRKEQNRNPIRIKVRKRTRNNGNN